MITPEDIIRLKQFAEAKSMSKAPEFRSTESLPLVNLDAISEQLIEGSLHSVPLYVGLEFAKERALWKADKQVQKDLIKDLTFVRDQAKEINEQLNKELGHLSAKNDQLINGFNEQSMALEQLLKALNKKPTTNNLVLDLAIAITELQAKGNKNV